MIRTYYETVNVQFIICANNNENNNSWTANCYYARQQHTPKKDFARVNQNAGNRVLGYISRAFEKRRLHVCWKIPWNWLGARHAAVVTYVVRDHSCMSCKQVRAGIIILRHITLKHWRPAPLLPSLLDSVRSSHRTRKSGARRLGEPSNSALDM